MDSAQGKRVQNVLLKKNMYPKIFHIAKSVVQFRPGSEVQRHVRRAHVFKFE